MNRFFGAVALAACITVSLISCGGGGSASPPNSPTSPSSAAATVTSVTVSGALSAAKPGDSAQFNASAALSDGTSRSVSGQASWQSSSTSVATVSSGGMVTAMAAGEADIRATYQNVTGGVHVTVTAPSPVPATFTISGVTKDGSFPISGATVIVKAAAFSTTSDGNGRYSIAGVSAGRFTLQATKSGYELTEVSVDVSGNTTADISMRQPSTPTPAPSPTPTPTPTPGSNTCSKPASAPGSSTAQCNDGSFSSSQNRSGTCSSHGGVKCFFCPGTLCAGINGVTATMEELISILEVPASQVPRPAGGSQ